MATRRPSGPARTTESPPPPTEKTTARRRATTVAPTPAAAAPKRVTVSEEARRAMIEKAAYLRAERRGFAPGSEEEDWLAAEAEVDALLRAGHGRPPQ